MTLLGMIEDSRCLRVVNGIAFGQHKNRTPTHGYAATRGRDGGVRKELGAGVAKSRQSHSPQSHISN
jgi:hypothetical protein